jgi:hypothetical protein
VAAVEVAVVSTLVVEAMVDLTRGSFMDLIRGRFIPVPAFIPAPFIPVPAFILGHFNSALAWIPLRPEQFFNVTP